MARHHIVPQFLLRRWATDGKFDAYYFEAAADRVTENPKAIVGSACQIADLNTYFGVAAADRDFAEAMFFTPVLDTPAVRSWM
jgi:hypothetical protein